MATVGTGQHTYEIIEDWGTLPPGWTFGVVSAVAVDSQDRVYVFHRKDPPIIVFDREGNYLTSWGDGSMTDPHGIHIDADDVIYVTDRDDHIALKFTLDGKLLMILGTRGQSSDTGCTEDAGTVLRGGEPFNKPTGMVPSPSGDLYVSDGYRNSRVHRFSAGGILISSWGVPGKSAHGEFQVPHCVWVDRQGVVYVCDRDNNRIQVFSRTGEFMDQWNDLHRPTCIYMDADETVYVSETAYVGETLSPRVGIWDKQGNLLERWDSPEGHWLYGDSRGDLYLAEVAEQGKVAKYVKRR